MENDKKQVILLLPDPSLIGLKLDEEFINKRLKQIYYGKKQTTA